MMCTRELTHPPRILPLYARALAPSVPGASHLPCVAGGGGEVPDLRLTLTDVRVDARHLTGYGRLCAFATHDSLPATYPHVLAFPLHLAVMADRRFPVPAMGLVHLANRITQHRPICREERIELAVTPTPLQPHPGGRTFSLVTEARVAGELVWRELSTMLRRERRERRAGAPPARRDRPAEPLSSVPAQWPLPGDLGRRYASVSGDRNPIHTHWLGARAFGFSRPIAHGMWTMARCLAAVEHRLPEAFTIDVRFRAPITLPGTVAFSKALEPDGIRFSVTDHTGARTHLQGRARSGPDEAAGEQRA